MLDAKERLILFLTRIIEEYGPDDRKAPIIRNQAIDRGREIIDMEVLNFCYEFTVYQLILFLIKRNAEIVRREKSREQRMIELNVPHNQRVLILKLGMDNARCPLRQNAYVDLYGPNQGSSIEIFSAAHAYDQPVKDLVAKRALLVRLGRLIEEQEKRGNKK
jgi:hypothetical protein